MQSVRSVCTMKSSRNAASRRPQLDSVTPGGMYARGA